MIGSLLDHLWQSTLFAGVIALAMPLFRRQAAALRFGLWFAASMKFLLPFALLTMLGRRILSATASAITAPVLAVLHPAAAPFAAIAKPLVMPAPSHLPTLDMAVVIWCSGLIAIALLCASRWLDLRAVLKDAQPVAIDAPVPVKSAPSFIEPGLVGIWRPVILLPAGLARHLTQAEMEAVLAHELCHLRRRDNLLASLHMLVEGLFWFHPLVWWIGKRLCEERERACDEDVVANGVSPLVYAEGILKTCRFYVQTPLACASGVSGADLKLRVSAIVADQPVMALTPIRRIFLALACTATLMLPLGAVLLSTAPAGRIAGHIATMLAAPEIAVPMASPAMPAPVIPSTRPVRHRAPSPVSSAPPAQTEPFMLVTAPTIRIDTVLDIHLPAISATSDDTLVCRKPQQLSNSRLAGPEVCLKTSQWTALHTNGMDIGPDGKSIIRTDYEKQKMLSGSRCPQSMIIGASTGWVNGSTSCF